MNYLVFARMLVIGTLYLDTVDEDIMDLDTAVQGTEEMAAVLKDLSPEEIVALDDALQQVALEYDGEARKTIKTMLRDYGVVDDPDDEAEGDD